MSSHPIVPRVRARRRPLPPEEAFAQWLARAAMRDTEHGDIAEVTLAHGRIGQRHSQPLESFAVDPDTVTVESAAQLAADIWAVAEAHATSYGKGTQRYDVLALYGPERTPHAQTSIRIVDEDEQGADIIEGVFEPANAAGWLAQTMRQRDIETRAFRSLLQETMVVIRAAGEMSRDRDSTAHAVAQAEVEKERIRNEEAERVRRFQIELEDRAEQRRAQEKKDLREDEERAHQRVRELAADEAKAKTEMAILERNNRAIEHGVDLVKIFVPMIAHRAATYFNGGSLPSTDNELLNAARLRGFLHTLGPEDVAKLTEALGGSGPKAMGFLDMLSAVMFGNALAKPGSGDGASSDGPTPDQQRAANGADANLDEGSTKGAAGNGTDADPGEGPTSSQENAPSPPSPRAQLFIAALRHALATPRSADELSSLRARIQTQLDTSPPLSDVQAVARVVEQEGFAQVADLFEKHLRERANEQPQQPLAPPTQSQP
jgi:hypothetical protein